MESKITATELMLAEENLRRAEVVHNAVINTHARVMRLESKLDWLIDLLKNSSYEKSPADAQVETAS